MNQKVRLILNDKDGVAADNYAENGEYVYSHHSSNGKELTSKFSPDWAPDGIVMVYGGSFKELADRIVRVQMRPLDALNQVKAIKFTSRKLMDQLSYLYDVGLITSETDVNLRG